MTRREDYASYLRSSEWKELRELALARTSGLCQFCGELATNVHHVRYPKRFGEEHPHSLVPVCGRCHKLSHGVQYMKPLSVVTQMSELAPFGGRLNYLLSNGRIYASAKSWTRALRIPESMTKAFETGLERVAILKKDLAGGDLQMEHQGTIVYRWHAAAEQLRVFDRAFHEHRFQSRPLQERREIEEFHDNYDKLVNWGYDLQERALNSILKERSESSAPVTQEMLVDSIKRAIAPRLLNHDEKLNQHDIVIDEIKEAVPALRDPEEFITVRQAISEKGYDPTVMPLHPRSAENLSGLTGQLLSSQGAEKGPSEVSRLDGNSVRAEVRTYRRRVIYSALADIMLKRQKSLSL